MRILVLGNNYSSKRFYELFTLDKNNIVFSNIRNFKNYIKFEDCYDIMDFCEANEIDLVLIVDEDYINQGLQELISSRNISAFSPSIEAIGISSSKSNAKKFIHHNKIPTARFQIADTPKMAMDYIKNVSFPLAIRPDNHNPRECTLFCETFSGAQKIINNFFSTGNKKIIIEDYIPGKNVSVWTLSDGYSARIIGSSAKYQNDIALFNPKFLTEDLKEEINQKIIIPTIDSLSMSGEEYIGILGFDIILDRNNKPYLAGYNSFFDDINVDFFIEGYDINWAEVFDSAIVGDVFLKYDIKPKNQFMATIKDKYFVNFFSAMTLSNLERYMINSGCNLEEYYEALKIWQS